MAALPFIAMALASSLLLLALLVMGVRGEAEREALISERRDACHRISNKGIRPRDPSQFPNRLRSQGGSLHYASPVDADMTDLDCAGVALLREIIRPYSLSRPRYSNAPHLLYVERGSGLLGIVTPGCPTTFRDPFTTPSRPYTEERRHRHSRRRRSRPYDYESESERESEYEYEEEAEDEYETRQRRQQQEQEQEQEKEGDTCQKVRRVKEGDLVVIFAGNTFWLDNDNPSQELRLVAIVDVSNNQNQLDRRYKTFLVSGEARLESEEGGEEGGVSRGVLQGFSNDVLQRALDIGNTTILRHIERRVSQQRQQGQGLHIRLHRGQLDIPHPRQRRGEESQQYYEPEYEEEEEEDEYKEEEEERRGRRRGSGNGVAEEGLCSMRLKQNLKRANNADIYVKGAGRMNVANSLKMPALRVVGLAADYVKLERRGAMFAPSYVVNAHRIMYVTGGRGRIQIVDDRGRRLFSGEVRQGQFLVLPQNFAAVKEATSQNFEWVAFLTNDRPLREQLVGRNSLIQSMPRQVVAATCGIRGNEAEQLLGSRQQTVGPILTPPSSYYYSRRSSSSSRTYPEDLDSTTESQTTETETKTEAKTETEAEAQTETQTVTVGLLASA